LTPLSFFVLHKQANPLPGLTFFPTLFPFGLISFFFRDFLSLFFPCLRPGLVAIFSSRIQASLSLPTFPPAFYALCSSVMSHFSLSGCCASTLFFFFFFFFFGFSLADPPCSLPPHLCPRWVRLGPSPFDNILFSKLSLRFSLHQEIAPLPLQTSVCEPLRFLPLRL